ELQQGIVLKHRIGGERYDSITHIYGPSGMPKNNAYWEKFYDKGINLVMDATDPMMVHFTAEQMISNNITTRGDNSDFEVITGSKYDDDENDNEKEKPAYIFRNRIIKRDVTCKNGYIHQVEDVLVPPGNLAEVIRSNGKSNYFSRMLDRFSAPFYESNLTRRYNDYAQAYGKEIIDSIFQMRYFSQRSQGDTLEYDPNRRKVPNLLNYDPGWNAYTNGMIGRNELSDLAAMFVPTDEAMKQYFLPGGSGAFLIDQFGAKENTEENLFENIDSIPGHIVAAFLNNLMKSSFVNTVPSKFGDIMDDASDPMGLNIENLNRNENGGYDVKIANNGVAYMLNTVFAPNQYVAVSAPAFLSTNRRPMRIMNTAIQDGSTTMGTPLGLSMNYYAYLLAMSANYGLFIPTDEAFGKYYIDPVSLKKTKKRALRFYYDSTASPYVFCSSWEYNPLTGEIGDSIQKVAKTSFESQLKDILNYHTVVLNEGEKMGTNLYYKTKHGGMVKYENGTVMSGGQIDEGLPVSNIQAIYSQKNGTAFAIDNLIQAPQKSVYAVLKDADQFSEFFSLLKGFDGNDDLFEFASDRMKEINSVTKKTRRDGYQIFVEEAGHYGLDKDVKFFNSYNYTVYVPDNDAMQKAYSLGLPTWDDIQQLYDAYKEEWDQSGKNPSPELQAARDKALAMIEEINAFVRYHFQDNSVYADNVIDAGVYGTACSDSLGIRVKLTVNGGGRILTVTDNRGNKVSIDANKSDKMVNQMTRDYVFDKTVSAATRINTSSFAVVHQISSPLNHRHKDEKSDRYDEQWSGKNAKQKLSAFRKRYETQLYKRY
ncbi:MAG: hypothetical protein IK067_06145, partial [Prevotella sp.]|nr:hypothetical protein [Prevotella sp.]